MHCLHPNTVLYLNNYKRKEVITMPRTKGSKNRSKTNTTKDYASQIAEKQEQITTLTTEIASIQKAVEEQKNTLKEKKIALKKAEKEAASPWKRRRRRRMLRPLKKLRRPKQRLSGKAEMNKNPRKNKSRL